MVDLINFISLSKFITLYCKIHNENEGIGNYLKKILTYMLVT